MSDFSHEAYIVQISICEAATAIRERFTAPHVMMKPRIFLDGNMWCALLGADIQVGICGFGDSPQKACEEFDAAWIASIPSKGES